MRRFYTPPHFSGEVLCYTLRCLSVRPSVRPSVRAHHFRSITWVFIHGIFSNFAYILLSAMSGMGLLMGKIRPFLTELLPFFVLEKWFLACYSFTVHDIWMKLHRYVAHQRLHIVTKDRHSDLPSLWVIRPWYVWKKVFDLLFLYYMEYLNITSQICFTSKVTYWD